MRAVDDGHNNNNDDDDDDVNYVNVNDDVDNGHDEYDVDDGFYLFMRSDISKVLQAAKTRGRRWS